MIAERNMMYYSNNEFGGGRYDHRRHHHHQRMARSGREVLLRSAHSLPRERPRSGWSWRFRSCLGYRF